MAEELSAEIVEVAEPTEVEQVVEQEVEPIEREVKEVQSKEENAEFARMRREAETKAKLEQAKVDAIIEAVGDNPYTGNPIRNKADADEYLLMKKIQKEGKDPIADYHEYVKPTNKEEWFNQDAKDFKSKYPDIDQSILNSDKFVRFAKGKVGVLPMAEIWADFTELFPQKKAEAQALANKKSTPGKLATPEQTDNLYSKEQLQTMTQKQMLDNWEKVQKSAKKYNINL